MANSSGSFSRRTALLPSTYLPSKRGRQPRTSWTPSVIRGKGAENPVQRARPAAGHQPSRTSSAEMAKAASARPAAPPHLSQPRQGRHSPSPGRQPWDGIAAWHSEVALTGLWGWEPPIPRAHAWLTPWARGMLPLPGLRLGQRTVPPP